MESETACRLKKWDLERVHQLKEKEEEEDKKAWDKMYRIQVKAISHSHSSTYAALIWFIWAKMYKIRVNAIFDDYDLFGLQLTILF